MSVLRNAFLAAAWMLVGISSVQAKSAYRELVAPDTELRDLRGPVKKLREVTYLITSAAGRVIQKERVLWFDREGYQITELVADVAALSQTTESRFYNEQHDLVRQETSEGKRLDLRRIETDPAKRQVTWHTANPSTRSKPARELVFDSFRKISAGRDFDAAGRLVQSYRVTRDERGLGTELVFLDAKGAITQRTVLTWDERGIMIGSVDEFPDSKSTATRIFEPVAVDASGNWTEMRRTTTFSPKDSKHPDTTEVVLRRFEYYPTGH